MVADPCFLSDALVELVYLFSSALMGRTPRELLSVFHPSRHLSGVCFRPSPAITGWVLDRSEHKHSCYELRFDLLHASRMRSRIQRWAGSPS